ncbi:MAG: hypothetical protein ACJAZ2_001661, partial [Glaciecola sp.]
FKSESTEVFIVSNENLVKDLFVYDQSGKLVKRITPSGLQKSVEVQLEKSGVYFVHVQSGNSTQVLKAVVVN